MGKFQKSVLRIIILGLSVTFTGCKKSHPEASPDSDYVASIEKWHQKRIERLKSPDGWLSLAGLYWLKEGRNSVGADSSNDIIFPPQKAPSKIGTFYLEAGTVTVRISPDVNVLHDGQPVDSMILRSDAEANPTILTYGSLHWYIIKRQTQYGVRLKDSQHPRISHFQGIEMFPIDSSWRKIARFEPYVPPHKIQVPTILGTIAEKPSPGALLFNLKGKTYRLDVIGEPDDHQFFVIFGDDTNGKQTYGAGRYLYVNNPGTGQTTIIDFNKAYNPPCVFSPYATCPFPPEQNILPVKITAGEKMYGDSLH